MILIERTFCAAAIQPPLGSEDQHLENLAINPEQLREEIGSKIKFHGKKKAFKILCCTWQTLEGKSWIQLKRNQASRTTIPARVASGMARGAKACK